MAGTDETWFEYWSDTPDDPYLAAEAQVLVGRLADLFDFEGSERILDYGCGYGYVAEGLSSLVGEVKIWDHVETVREHALARISRPNVALLDPTAPGPPFDLIVVNSVIQYMSEETLAAAMAFWGEILAKGGSIALTDVPAEPPSLIGEGIAWFRLAARHGVVGDALRFVRSNADRYRRARSSAALATWGEAKIRGLAEEAGLIAEKQPTNLAYQRKRDSYLLRHA